MEHDKNKVADSFIEDGELIFRFRWPGKNNALVTVMVLHAIVKAVEEEIGNLIENGTTDTSGLQ